MTPQQKIKNKQVNGLIELGSVMVILVFIIAGIPVAELMLSEDMSVRRFLKMSGTDNILFMWGVVGIFIGVVILALCLFKAMIVFKGWLKKSKQ